MPELPEVETVRRGLVPLLEGRRLVRVEARRGDLRRAIPGDLSARLTGRRVLALRRRAKYLLCETDGGDVLLLHLGMSGRIRSGPAAGTEPGRHDHLLFDTEDGIRLLFNDARRFGLALLLGRDTAEAHPLLAGLGPEPLGNAFQATHLLAACAGRRTSLKAALLDQRLVAGLGNIYVSEALHRAGLSPRRLAANLGPARAERLVAAIRAVLEEAIAAGGSTLRNHAQVDGELGYFQHAFRVYDRTGAPCPAPGCHGTVRRIVQSGRSTFLCPACQR